MLTDSWKKLSGGKINISFNTEITGFDKVSEALLKSACTTKGAAAAVTCEVPITAETKETILREFGVTALDCEDAFVILAENEHIRVQANSSRAALYAASCIAASQNEGFDKGLYYSCPSVDFRMIKLYLPSEENIPFFKEFIDLCVYYGYNTVMLELGGAMEYVRHPEINEGWIAYSRETSAHINHRGTNPHFPYRDENTYFLKNSIHCENGDGTVLPQKTVRELAAYCRERFMEVIPEVPSLSHSDYLLTRHPELAERGGDLYPDAYCPSNEASYRLLFDVLEEVIAVFEPARINIGHDELYSLCICEKCRGKNPADVYANDIKKIYQFLKERNVKTMIWSDKLIPCIDKTGTPHGGAEKEVHNPHTGKLTEVVPPTYSAIDKIPGDIQLLHWFWSMKESTEVDFKNRGFWTAIANFESLRIKNAKARLKKGLDGIGISNWSKVDELHVQRNGIYMDLAMGAMLVWNGPFEESDLDASLQAAAADLYRYRTRSAPHKAEIVHTFLKDVPFEQFLDGYEIDREKNIIGYYIAGYEDGTSEKFPIEYGRTIGYARVDRKRRESAWCASYEPDRRLAEPSYSCDYVFEGEKIYYRYAILSEKKITSLRIEPKAEYETMIDVKEVCLEA